MANFTARSTVSRKKLTASKSWGGVDATLAIFNPDTAGLVETFDIRVSPKNAHALADWIKANIALPLEPTIREQYLKLAPGTRFKRADRHDWVKVNDELVYSTPQGDVREVKTQAVFDRREPIIIVSKP